MFCSHCGKQVDENASFCASCGSQLNTGNIQNGNSQQNFNQMSPNQMANQPMQQGYNGYIQPQPMVDSGSVGWAFLGFFVPIVGLILFCVWREDKPKSSKMAGLGALICVCISVFVGIIMGIMIAIYPELYRNIWGAFIH